MDHLLSQKTFVGQPSTSKWTKLSPPLAQALLLQPIHPTPVMPHSHLVLALQRPTVEEDAEGDVGLHGHFPLTNAHHLIIPRLQVFLGNDDQSVEYCMERSELELPITFPIPQSKAHTYRYSPLLCNAKRALGVLCWERLTCPPPLLIFFLSAHT